MKKAIEQIWADIKQGENIDLYLAVLFSIVLAVFNLFGLGQAQAGPITLAVLGLLALSALVNRRKLDETIARVRQENTALLESFPAVRADHIRGAKELWLVGISLNKTISSLYPLLLEKLKHGDTIRVLIVHPASPHGDLVARRKFSHEALADVQNYQKLTLSKLCTLVNEKNKRFPNLEIRTTEYPPFFGATATDLNSPQGNLYIEQYAYQMEDDLPRMVFTPADPRWFQFYSQQIQKMWADGRAWTCDQGQDGVM